MQAASKAGKNEIMADVCNVSAEDLSAMPRVCNPKKTFMMMMDCWRA